MMKRQHSAIIAISFVVLWLSILYAGADHPPPSGFFIWIFPAVCICGLAVFLRIPVYASWCSEHRRGRFASAIRDGLFAGLVVAVVTLFVPNTGEPGLVPPAFTSAVIWILVLMAVGCLNALLLYGAVSAMTKSRH